VRIIAGRLKGRQLAGPRGTGVRPTSDKLRETLFNILAPRIEGARVVDGFAGTGANGLEAISRGAASVLFIERDRQAIATIEENLRRCGLEGGYAMMRGAFEHMLDRLAPDVRFDLILLDPPYDHADVERTLAAAASRVEPQGLVVLEHARRRAVPERAGSLARVRVVTSGDSALTLFEPAKG
jgi:16S rRNA (guanine(966)-N(2))-methyltransferase RsmD